MNLSHPALGGSPIDISGLFHAPEALHVLGLVERPAAVSQREGPLVGGQALFTVHPTRGEVSLEGTWGNHEKVEKPLGNYNFTCFLS